MPSPPSLSSDFCLSFKVWLESSLLQEDFLDVVVLKYVHKFFDTFLLQNLIPLPLSEGWSWTLASKE